MADIEEIKEAVKVLEELEDIDIELNKKCKQAGDDIDLLKRLVTESNDHLHKIIHNLIV
jgi:hypothetical protein